MPLKGLRLLVIIVSTVIVFSGLLGGTYLYQRYFVQQPLQEIIGETSIVNNLKIEEASGKKVITLELGEVENLQETYQQLQQAVTKVYPETPVEIRILDQRNEQLKRVLYDTQLIVEEAIARGNFTEMANGIHQVTDKAGIQNVGIYVDQDNIYLQIEQGENYLYKIFPRNREDASKLALYSDGKGGGVK